MKYPLKQILVVALHAMRRCPGLRPATATAAR